MTTTSITTEPSFNATEESEREFRALAAQCHRDTAHLSSMSQKINHPAYQRIIGMGSAVLPLLLQELEQRPDHWFRALADITGENLVPKGSTFGQARTLWLAWGRQQGYIE